jgi:hypothetical protein
MSKGVNPQKVVFINSAIALVSFEQQKYLPTIN